MHSFKISQRQLRMIIISSITVTGHLLFVPIVLNIAGRDSWLSLPFAIIVGLLFSLLLSALWTNSPNKTLIELSSSIMGRFLGKIIGLAYVAYFCIISSVTIGALIDFMTTSLMSETPPLVFACTFLLVCGYGVFLGLEDFLRANEIFLPVLIVIGILISLIVLPFKNFKYLLPVMEDGFKPILLGSIPLIALLAETVVIGIIHPTLNQVKLIKKIQLVSITVIAMLFVGPLTGPIAMFGTEAAKLKLYPTFQEIKGINIDYVGNLSPFAVILWLIGSFGKITLFYYASSIGAAQVFKLKDYRKLIIPIGLIIMLLTVTVFPNIRIIRRFLSGIYIVISCTMGIAFPIILLGLMHFKNLETPTKNRYSI